MSKQSPSHERYMERYNKRNWRERVESSGQLAPRATDRREDWPGFYICLYTKLGLGQYLGQVLNEL